MATVRQLEARIERIESLRVRLLRPGGRDVRSDRANLPQYGYERAASDGVTVRRLKDGRFTELLGLGRRGARLGRQPRSWTGPSLNSSGYLPAWLKPDASRHPGGGYRRRAG